MAMRIGQAVTRLAETGQGDVTKLAGSGGEYRLRVGDWRVRFAYDVDADVLVVTRILRRNEGTYRR